MKSLGSRLAATFLLFVAVSVYADPPAGFVEETVFRPDGAGWNEAVGLTFAPDGLMFVWERKGRIWIVDEDNPFPNPAPTPLLDISEEVGGWRDYGLLGVALHPNFYSTGHIYLLYVVDRHHLLHCTEQPSGVGAPTCDGGYNASTDEYFNATIGRVTRYTVDFTSGMAVDYSSRKVLLGESIDTGIPILHQSHGTGSLVFGTDGTLLASTGDGASYSSTDSGSAGETYYAQGIADGIIRPEENVGAFRSQMLSSLDGKVLRIDSDTGDGVSSNPFYETTAPRSAKSRVWALGLRNPFRMTLRPESGSHDPADGDPGTLYIGDVGWGTWEDLNISVYGGENFGWPVYEGMTTHGGYSSRTTQNADAPNPMFGIGGCTQEFFEFRELIKQDTLNSVSFINSCDGSAIPPSVDTFVHNRPTIDWRHGQDNARWASYALDGTEEHPQIGQADSNGLTVDGTPFRGNSSTGGVWYTGDDFPSEYKDTYFHAEYGGQWIRNFVFGAADNPMEVRDFNSSAGGVVALATHPINGHLYYISWATNVRRVVYDPGGNLDPVAVGSADVAFGSSPLTVQFTGDASSDPDGSIASYNWDFGDGNQSNTANPQHTFVASSGAPESFNVTLTVIDNQGASNSTSLLISTNNSPPSAMITSPADGTKYPLTGDTTYDLIASVNDAEHSLPQLTCTWQTILHHNEHTHSDPPVTGCSQTTVISPLGCGTEIYYFRVTLKVSDPEGLEALDEVVLLPNCAGSNNPPVAMPDSGQLGQGESLSIDVLDNDTDDQGLDPSSVAIDSQPSAGTITAIDPVSGAVTYTHDGGTTIVDSFTYTVRDTSGLISNVATVNITIDSGGPQLQNVAPLATVTASSQYSGAYAATNAVDGIADGDPTVSGVEWASRGQKAGAWLNLDWGGISHNVSQVALYDRPNSVDQVLSGTLSFSDGSTIPVGELPNSGPPLTINFAPRAVTSLRFTVDSTLAGTKNIGLSEIEVYEAVGNLAPVANPDTAAVFVGQTIVIPVLDNDTDDQGLNHGSVAIGTLPTAGSIGAIDPVTGAVTYTHDGGSDVTDSFTYTVLDTEGVPSNAATVDISIGPYTPPTINILAPTDGQLVTDSSVSVTFDKAGDSTAYNHVHVRLDNDPYTAIHDMSVTSFDFGPVAPGAHSITAWLVDANHQALTNPESTATVSFDVAVATPTISPNGGTYIAPQLIILSSTTTGATIYYTLDSTEPDQSSVAYDGNPILIDTTSTLKARAYLGGAAPSSVASADFVFQTAVQNVAPLATVTASSQYSGAYAATNAVDGIADGDPNVSGVEWASRRQKAGAWLNLDWGGISHNVTQVVLYDRPNSNDQVLSGTLTFSDGSSVSVGPLANDGSALTIDFAPRNVTSMRFTVDSVSSSTRNIGLAEIEVNEGVGNLAPVANPDTAAVFVGQTIVIPVLDNDTDDQGLNHGSVAIGTLPTAGSIGAIDPVTGAVTYTHDGGSDVTDSFTYTVLDTEGVPSNAATVDISIGPYTPPTINILAPTDGQLVTDSSVSVTFDKAGDSTAYNHVHVRLDNDPYTAIHDMSVTSFDFGPVAPGAHSITAWLVDANHQALTNPESTATVSFDVAVATPTISPNGGTYIAPQLIILSSTTTGATIYYTLDSTEPDQSSVAYDGNPILIDTTSTLKARAYLGGAAPSSVASADFVFQTAVQNVAPLATVTASSQYSGAYAATNAVDGIADGDPNVSGVEWASRRQKAGAWLNLDWGGISHNVTQVVLYDRPNSNDQVLSGTLTFSDGSSVSVGPLANDGSALTIDFAPRNVTSMRFTVDSVSSSTRNIGLAEIEANIGVP